MKTFIAIAIGALAFVGCGPLEESELDGQVAQAVEQKRPMDGSKGDGVPNPVPKELLKSDQEKLYAPERPTFVSEFISQTDINPALLPVKP